MPVLLAKHCRSDLSTGILGASWESVLNEIRTKRRYVI